MIDWCIYCTRDMQKSPAFAGLFRHAEERRRRGAPGVLHGEIDLFFLDIVLLDVAGEHQGQSAVAGDVAGGAEGVLQGEDGEHQGRAGVVEAQDRDNQAQRGHDGTAGDAGGADGEDAQQHAEQDHGAHIGQRAVEDLGDDHDEEDFGQD